MCVCNYVCVCMLVCALQVAFYLPQLVQSLRNDSDGTMAAALLHKAQASDMFAHQVRLVGTVYGCACGGVGVGVGVCVRVRV